MQKRRWPRGRKEEFNSPVYCIGQGVKGVSFGIGAKSMGNVSI